MKKLMFYGALLLVSMVSCQQEKVHMTTEEQPQQSEIDLSAIMVGTKDPVPYLESQAFRDILDDYGMEDLRADKNDVVINDAANDDVDILEESSGEQGIKIKIIITQDPNLAPGIYILDLCDGTLMDILGNVVGTAAGTYTGC